MYVARRLIKYLTIFIVTLSLFQEVSASFTGSESYLSLQSVTPVQSENQNRNSDTVIHRLSNSLYNSLSAKNMVEAQKLVSKIIPLLNSNKYSDDYTCEANYFVGIYYLYALNYYKSIEYLNKVILSRELNRKFDTLYAKANYNFCLAASELGNYIEVEIAALKSLEAYRNIYSDTSKILLDSYTNLVNAKIELQKYDEGISLSNAAMKIAGPDPHGSVLGSLTIIYHNLGVCYLRLADYSNGKLYLEKTEQIWIDNKYEKSDSYLNLLNSLAILNVNLKSPLKADMYYKQALEVKVKNNLRNSFNVINSYALFLGDAGNTKRGEELLFSTLYKAENKYGKQSREYIEVVLNYANYLREYKIDYAKSLDYFNQCIVYLNNNTKDIQLRSLVYLGYSSTLSESGSPGEALKIIQKALFTDEQLAGLSDSYANPDEDLIVADRKSLAILTEKYEILQDLYKEKREIRLLEAAARTSELLITVLEKVRININDEESRLILGDKYRKSYLNAIRDFNLLFSITDDRNYLEKAYKYSEKSKVAGLLAATRELKASQFQIPVSISDYESRLKKDIGIYNEYITKEVKSEIPDSGYLKMLREHLLNITMERDSLIQVFETEYPDYYAIKYNTEVAELKDLSHIIGRNGNYINYISSDTILYIFVANRKFQNITALKVDTSFIEKLTEFRSLLSRPDHSENSRLDFERFVICGNEIFEMVIKPVIPYLISDKLIISPDNILSYIPFEALLTSSADRDIFSYNKLPYLMNEYDISYTYSATFMGESARTAFVLRNNLIAFAPEYTAPIEIQKVMNSRQAREGFLPDLPFAREEARYVTEITGGNLYTNEAALESKFKSEAGKFDIIHLAMHTLLNDTEPMYSTLIFNQGSNEPEDGLLKTYELYGIPLKARMVVLSSCNTGNGLLSSGEGILSLARGFIYSGSQSVVMSLWEIEDNSGTDIVKYFYDNLKKGKSKSEALKDARIKYLKKADSLRSHPYFWATLVVYGNNSSLFYDRSMFLFAVFIAIAITLILIYYLRKRRYS